MWLIPLAATLVAGVFAAMLARQFLARHGQAQLLWAIAMGMFAVASAAVTIGVASGWTTRLYGIYWALGAVLNVAFLAGGELVLLFRKPWVRWAVWLVLIFATAFTVAVVSGAQMSTDALAVQLPRGIKVLGDGTPAHRLAQQVAYPAYAILLLGTLWSAWKMRGRPELRDRFIGTLADRARRDGGGCRRGLRGDRRARRVHRNARRRDLPDVLGVPAGLTADRRSGCGAGRCLEPAPAEPTA